MLDDCAIDAPEDSSNKLQALASRHQDWLRRGVLSGGEEEEGRGVAEGKSLRRQREGANQCLSHVVVSSWC
jgi:hypothetical protein